jgi:hypothetical protein
MKKFLFFILLAASTWCSAQGSGGRQQSPNIMARSLFYTGVNGTPINTQQYSRLVDGTPYFNDDWRKATVIMPNGNAYENVDVRIDLLEGTLHYRNGNGDELVANAPVKEVVLSDNKAEGYRFVSASALPFQASKKGWYLLLHSGTASLYKHYGKQLHVQTRYGSASEEQRILDQPAYFIVQDGTATEIKKLKEISRALPGKKAELEAFLKQQATAASDDDRFREAVLYYNTLLH